MGLSALVITYNEEAKIEQCLKSLSFADEIVVLDSHSTDRTLDIAREYAAQVATREFTGFSNQKNAAIGMATQDWVLIVDADEVVSKDLASDILVAMDSDKYGAYKMPRATYFMGRLMRHCGWYPDHQLRLVKRELAHIPHRIVHETLHVDCPVGCLKHDLVHYSYSSMDDYCRKMVSYARAGAQQKFADGRRFHITDLLFTPWMTFFKMYVLKRGFLDGVQGLVLSVLSGCSSALRYSVLWELTLRNKEHDNEKQ